MNICLMMKLTRLSFMSSASANANILTPFSP